MVDKNVFGNPGYTHSRVQNYPYLYIKILIKNGHLSFTRMSFVFSRLMYTFVLEKEIFLI